MALDLDFLKNLRNMIDMALTGRSDDEQNSKDEGNAWGLIDTVFETFFPGCDDEMKTTLMIMLGALESSMWMGLATQTETELGETTSHQEKLNVFAWTRTTMAGDVMAVARHRVVMEIERMEADA